MRHQQEKNPDVPTALPKREEIDSAYIWRLEDIYPSIDEWEKDFDGLEKLLPRFQAYQGCLLESAATLLDGIRLMENAEIIMGKLYAYAVMKSHEDTSKEFYQALADRVGYLLTKLTAAISFYTPEILSGGKEVIDGFLGQSEDLKQYAFFFENILRMAPHTLTPSEEELLARSGEVARGPENIFSLFTNADMVFPEVFDEDGNTIELSEERYTRLIRSQDRQVRREAYEGLFGTYSKYRNSLAAMYSSSVKGDLFYAMSRKYGSCLEAALDSDHIPLSVYDSVVDTVRFNLKPLHEYVALRKEILNVPELCMYDLYVPLANEIKKNITYEEALAMVVKGLEPLGEEYISVLKHGFEAGWIDVYENQGKRKGAYSWGSYGTHPYVLLNYNGTIQDVFTIAHEMGHAIHTWYSHGHQPFIYADYTIFLAEVASTTNEALLLDHLLESSLDRQSRLYLLNYSLEQIRTTVYRQAMFADFERQVHNMAEAGEPLTAERLSALWHGLNVTYYGPEISVDAHIDIEWARIPHFYTAFYVYKYVTGYAAATSLSQRIVGDGIAARKSYLDFLKQGGAAYSIDILKNAGVDMATPQPLQDTLNLFKEKLGELKDLL